jgi:hypothetical protein
MQGLLVKIDPATAALIFAAVLLASWGAGFGLGRRLRTRGKPRPAGKLDDASLAILGLLLAFTFSMALGKYDRRREMLVTDSNSIGDFYTCASLIRDPVKTRLQGVIREYAELRVRIVREARSASDFEAAVRRFAEMQGRMTALVGEALAEGTPVAIPLTNTLNNLTSAHAARLVAFRDRLPGSVVLLLLASGALSTFLVGRSQGSSDDAAAASMVGFLLLVSLVVWVIFDLNDPTRGLITLSQEPMQRVLQSMTP